jgi:hypothetical protein
VALNFGAETLLSADIQNLKGERAKGCGCFIYAECLVNVAGGRVNLCQSERGRGGPCIRGGGVSVYLARWAGIFVGGLFLCLLYIGKGVCKEGER